MSPELLLAAFAGAGAGAASGLLPGLHPNALAVLALGLLPAAGPGIVLPLAVALVAMGIAHQFTSVIPASFLGAPGPEDALRALPAQELLHEGRALEAVQLAAKGTAWGCALAMALVLPLRALLGPHGEGYRWLEPALPVVLAAIAAVLLLTETASVPWRPAVEAQPFPEPGQREVRGRLQRRQGSLLRVATPRGGRWVHDPLGLLADAQPGSEVVALGPWCRVPARGSKALGVLAAMLVFTLAAALGLAVQRLATPSPLGLPASPMFPLLTGLFGAPSLLLALRQGRVPRQPERPAAEPAREVAGASAAGAVCGVLVGLLPGMSSSAATVLALAAAPRRSREGVLVTLSAAGASAAVLTASAYVLVQRARSGAMLAVAELVPPEPWPGALPPRLLALLLLGCAAGALVGYGATLAAGRAAARVVHHVPYGLLSAGVLVLLAGLVLAFTGMLGLAVLGAATLVGLLPWRWGLRKGHLMGCTMGPLMLAGLA